MPPGEGSMEPHNLQVQDVRTDSPWPSQESPATEPLSGPDSVGNNESSSDLVTEVSLLKGKVNQQQQEIGNLQNQVHHYVWSTSSLLSAPTAHAKLRFEVPLRGRS